MSLDDKIGSLNAPSRALYEPHTHYRGSDPRSVTADNREAPSSGSFGNLGQGLWDERHPSSVGPALVSEGHYADTAVVVFQDGSGQNKASKIDKTLARGTATTLFHTGACSEREPVLFHSTMVRIKIIIIIIINEVEESRVQGR